MEALHHTGPLTVTIRLAETDDGWLFGLDTRGGNGCGISAGLTTSRPRLTRASAIASAVRWVRAEHRDLTPALDAWLAGLTAPQLELFAA